MRGFFDLPVLRDLSLRLLFSSGQCQTTVSRHPLFFVAHWYWRDSSYMDGPLCNWIWPWVKCFHKSLYTIIQPFSVYTNSLLAAYVLHVPYSRSISKFHTSRLNSRNLVNNLRKSEVPYELGFSARGSTTAGTGYKDHKVSGSSIGSIYIRSPSPSIQGSSTRSRQRHAWNIPIGNGWLSGICASLSVKLYTYPFSTV